MFALGPIVAEVVGSNPTLLHRFKEKKKEKQKMDDMGFKFKVGDVLQAIFTPKTIEKDEEPSWVRAKEVFKLHVIERLYQECPGGIQRHYICRPITAKDGSPHIKYIQFNEIEVVAYEEPVKK